MTTPQTNHRPQVDLASLRHAPGVPLFGARIPRQLASSTVQHLVRVEVGTALEQLHESLPAADQKVHIYRAQLDEIDDGTRTAWAVAIERADRDIVIVSCAAGERLWGDVCRVRNWQCPVAVPHTHDPRTWVYPGESQ